MSENVSTIPINDIFNPKCGCPFCRAYSFLEKRSIEYILEGAMMQPDIRLKTNETGFCENHFKKMTDTGNRLQNALLLQSHMKYISENIFSGEKIKKKSDKNVIAALKKINNECYICERIGSSLVHLMKTTVNMWKNDENFRQMFSQQEYFCLRHYEMIIEVVLNSGISKKEKNLFCDEVALLCNKYLDKQRENVDSFCAMFDYRNTGNAKVSPDCIEKSIDFLCGTMTNTL